MLNERPSDNFHWKNKLETLESLPGDAFNKEKTWEKLHKRMHRKTANKKAIWYWAAAACLLAAIIIPWLLFTGKREVIVVKNNMVPKQIRSASPDILTQKATDTATVVSLLPTERRSSSLSNEKPARIMHLSRPGMISSKATLDKKEEKEEEEFITQKLTINTSTVVDSAIHIVAVLPEKKKLKVVHVNELGDPVEEYPGIARSHDRRSLVKFINQEINTSLPSGSTGFNIFKTKNTPSN